MTQWKTYGEALLERELKTEKREGVEHYVQGQGEATFFTEEEGVAFVHYGSVNAMGYAIRMLYAREPDGHWMAVAAWRSGVFTGPVEMGIPACFEPNDELVAMLDAAYANRERRP